MTHPSHAHFLLFCEEGLPSGMFLSGGDLPSGMFLSGGDLPSGMFLSGGDLPFGMFLSGGRSTTFLDYVF